MILLHLSNIQLKKGIKICNSYSIDHHQLTGSERDFYANSIAMINTKIDLFLHLLCVWCDDFSIFFHCNLWTINMCHWSDSNAKKMSETETIYFCHLWYCALQNKNKIKTQVAQLTLQQIATFALCSSIFPALLCRLICLLALAGKQFFPENWFQLMEEEF